MLHMMLSIWSQIVPVGLYTCVLVCVHVYVYYPIILIIPFGKIHFLQIRFYSPYTTNIAS
jgi:hypothetical protein